MIVTKDLNNLTAQLGVSYQCIFCSSYNTENINNYGHTSRQDLVPICSNCMISLKSLINREKQIPNI